MVGLIIPLVLLVLGCFLDKLAEARHYRSLRLREASTSEQPALTLDAVPFARPVERVEIAAGSVVISIDYFKRFLASLRMLFGGEMSSYSSLIDRARREALLRMKESCTDADLFINTRLETATISRGKSDSIGCVEVVAYSTAIHFDT